MSTPITRFLLCLAFAAAPAFAADQIINVLTGGTSGVYYPLGVALANNIGKALPAVKTSVQATKASVENAPINWEERIFATAAAFLLVVAIPWTDEAGFALAAAFVGWHWLRTRPVKRIAGA